MILLKNPLSFVDIETNGGVGEHGRIIEIGVVRVENNQLVDEYETFVDPGDRIPSFITRLTGISNDHLETAPTFRGIADELRSRLDGSIFIAHNAGFDYSFIGSEYRRIGEDFEYLKLCTARLSRALFPEQDKHNLDRLIKEHGLTVERRHRALDDARALWHFYQACLREFDLDTIDGAVMKQLRPLRTSTKPS